MQATFYKIFNVTEFEALSLTSKTYTLNLDGIGEKDILVVKGNVLGMVYEGIYVPVEMNDENPFVKYGESDSELALASYIDANDDVYLGIENEN